MNQEELAKLKRKIKALKVLDYIFWVVNILLIVIPFYHYYKKGFSFDLYFALVTVLNILGFYCSYIITDKTLYFKRKHQHFSEKLIEE